MYKNPKRLFVFILLAVIVTVINIVFSLLIAGLGDVGLVIALILIVLNALTLIFLFVYSFISLIRYIADKEKKHLGLHIFNFLFSIVAVVIFIVLYLTLMILVLIPLLPFL